MNITPVSFGANVIFKRDIRVCDNKPSSVIEFEMQPEDIFDGNYIKTGNLGIFNVPNEGPVADKFGAMRKDLNEQIQNVNKRHRGGDSIEILKDVIADAFAWYKITTVDNMVTGIQTCGDEFNTEQ